MSEELKPCPFCGKKAKICQERIADTEDYYVFVACSGSCPVFFDNEENMIEQWNTRAEQPTINTFEELAEKLGAEKHWFGDFSECYLLAFLNGRYVRYYKNERLLSIGTLGNFVPVLENVTPQQAYNIITALKDNLGG